MAKTPPTMTFHEGRFRALIDRRYGSLNAADAALGRDGQASRWGKGESVPGGDALEQLCFDAGCSPAYLFGRPMEEVTDYLARTVGSEIAPEMERILRLLTAMGASDRQRVLQVAQSYGVQAVPKPREPFEDDESGPVSEERPQRTGPRAVRDDDAKKQK